MAIEHQVFRFDITMYDELLMYEFQGRHDTSHEKFGLILGKYVILGYMVSQITSRVQIHDQIQIIIILESILHVDYEWMFELGQYFPFVDN